MSIDGMHIVERYCARTFDAPVPPPIERAAMLAGRAGFVTAEVRSLIDSYRRPVEHGPHLTGRSLWTDAERSGRPDGAPGAVTR